MTYDVTVYAPGCLDYDNEGLVGPLPATSCEHTEQAGGMSEITMTLPYDDLGKWRAVTVGCGIKAYSMMRTPPAMDGSTYLTSVEVYSVAPGATKAQRGIYSKKAGGSLLKRLSSGTEVLVVSRNDELDRWKVRYGKITGWMDKIAITYERRTTITGDANGMERLVPAAVAPQIYDVDRVTLGDNEVTVHAMHQSYRLLKNLVRYKANSAVELSKALERIRENALDGMSDWGLYTDVSGSRVGIDWRNINPIKAMMDPEIGVLGRWDCELYRDGMDLYFLGRAGLDRGVRIEYGKNLSGLTFDTDESEVATYIVPIGVGKDGSPYYLPEKWIVSPYADLYPEKRIYSFPAEDATIGADGATEANVRARMRDQAQRLLDNGCDLPRVTVTVEVSQTSDMALREPLCVYDVVHIYEPRRGISMTERVVERVWDCLRGRMIRFTVGSVAGDMTATTIPSWQISTVSGSKIMPGSVGSLAMGDNAVGSRHIQAESINTQALQAEVITAEKIAADDIKARAGEFTELQAAFVEVVRAYINNLTAAQLTTDLFAAQVARISNANIGTLDVGFAHIKDIVNEQIITQDGTADRYFISKLQVTALQAAYAAVDKMVLGAVDEDGNRVWYALRVQPDGSLSTEPVTPTTEEVDAGVTAAGQPIIGTDITADSIAGTTVKAINALIDTITAARLDVDALFARDAFLTKLTTGDIFADGGSLRVWKNEYDRIVTIDGERGTLFHDAGDVNSGVLIDRESKVNIVQGGRIYSTFAQNYVQFGNYQIRRSADGGMVFKLKEG